MQVFYGVGPQRAGCQQAAAPRVMMFPWVAYETVIKINIGTIWIIFNSKWLREDTNLKRII